MNFFYSILNQVDDMFLPPFLVTQQTYVLYLLFLLSYSIASFSGFVVDMKFDPTRHIQETHRSKMRVCGDYFKALPLVSFNVFVTIPLSILIFQPLQSTMQPFNFYQLLHIPAYVIISDFVFYVIHRLLHTSKLYKIHKIHHRFTRPMALASIYSHPLEIFFGNIVPLFVPIVIFNSSFPILYAWTFLITFETTYSAHSGIKNRGGEGHDLHHKLFNFNYGSGFLIFDKLFGTYMREERFPLKRQ
jgi:sterol desaturase/sphingolipid hydroxylase (fatty acid hydroxylase superfamily)